MAAVLALATVVDAGAAPPFGCTTLTSLAEALASLRATNAAGCPVATLGAASRAAAPAARGETYALRRYVIHCAYCLRGGAR